MNHVLTGSTGSKNAVNKGDVLQEVEIFIVMQAPIKQVGWTGTTRTAYCYCLCQACSVMT